MISTSALMGLRPIAFSRFCSQSGEGPFLTPRTTRPANTGQASALSLSKSSLIGTGSAKLPFTGLMASALSLPRPAAARSRAMPRTPRQSGRLGVMATSMTASSRPSAFAAGLPILADAGSSMMPLCSSDNSSSRSDSSMPLDSTPRILALVRVRPEPGMVLPTGANTAFNPARALGAPHTTCNRSLPVSTSHTWSLSALGCFSHFKTCATRNGASVVAGSNTSSTSSPMRVSISAISATLARVSI